MSIEQLIASGSRRQRRSLAIAIALAVLAALAAVGLLAMSGWFLTGAAIAGLSGAAAVQAFNYLIPSAAIRAMAIIRTAGRYGERLFSHRAALFVIAELRPALFTRLATQDAGHALRHAPGEVAAQLGEDVDALEDRVVRRVTAPSAIAAALAALLAALAAGLVAGLVVLAGLAAMRLASRRLSGDTLLALHREHGAALAALKSSYADYAACGTEIAVFGLADTVSDELQTLAARLDAARLAIVRREALVAASATGLATLTAALVLALATGPAPLAALAVLAVAAGLENWGALSRTDLQGPRIVAALERLRSLSSNAAAVGPRKGGLPGEVAIRIVHGGETIELQPGERLLVGGASGAGKTRLVETLMGLRSDAPQELAAPHVQFAYVPQDASLIAGTIADNLRMARKGVSEDDMWQALDIACVGDVVRGLADGLDYWLSSDSAALSGGQRKRIALARGLLAGRDWLVLDEPTEGLDAATEARLVDRLEQWLDATGSGLLLVSHRAQPRRLARRQLQLGD